MSEGLGLNLSEAEVGPCGTAGISQTPSGTYRNRHRF